MMTLSAEEEQKTSPMMLQWHQCKQSAKDALLLFRMGDFYEAFYDDAVVLSKEVDLTLTKRQNIPMSGIPFHTSEGYIDKLVAKGYRVAIAEQVEDPKKAKGLVKREVVRIVTPGTLINSNLLSEKSNNFFASLIQTGQMYGLAFIDLTTAEFSVTEFETERALLNEVFRLRPAEFLTSEKFKAKHSAFFEEVNQTYSFLVTSLPDWNYEHQTTYSVLKNHFKVHTLDGFGITGMSAAINAAGALLKYLQEGLSLPTQHIEELRPYSTSQFMSLDRITLRNLELTNSLHDGSKKNTLLSVLDYTLTPMGGRLIQHWIKQPLLSIPAIKKRQEAIQSLLNNDLQLLRIQSMLKEIKDIERIIMKISAGYAGPRDLLALHLSFQPVGNLKATLSGIESLLIQEEASNIDPLPEMNHKIAQAIVEDPPLRIGEGNIFKEGYHRELDELREISKDSKTWIARYQSQLREETGIKLTVGYNRLSGYFIEVPKAQAHKMPDNFIRRQTLVNSERFISPVLKEYETKVLSAEEKIEALESELFQQLRAEIIPFSQRVLKVGQAIGRLDTLVSLAHVAKENHYCCPVVHEGNSIEITNGRHPVIELVCRQEAFIPNDTFLNDKNHRLLLITGPNMAGKSTFLRQTALIVIMSQIGSFIPATQALIGITDKVFTRIGASDDLSRGHSTFMVEMTETANILHNATSRSLVILDEIGRGTSTYDGISIAWSVAEFLLTTEGKTAKTLFATHYWELTKLENLLEGAVNYHVAAHREQNQITFLRKIVKGGTDKSYGIDVASLAGLPSVVLERAKEILDHLESNANEKNHFEPPKQKKIINKTKPKPQHEFQLSLFE